MAKRVAGICYIKVDGEQLTVEGGVECPLMDVNRETVMAVDAPAGFKETAIAPYVKLSAIFVAAFPLDKLRENTEMTVTAELANGKVYTLSGAYLVGETPVKGSDGMIDLEFNGAKGIWQ